MTERIENYARIVEKERIRGTITYYSGQSDVYTWIVTNHNNLVVYTFREKVVTTVLNMIKDQYFRSLNFITSPPLNTF